MPRIELTGLRGIFGLNSSDQNKLMQQYISSGTLAPDASLYDADRVYRNRLLYNRYGADVFYSTPTEELDEMYYQDTLREQLFKNLNPYIDDDPSKGVDPMKGAGNDWFKINQMSLENQRALYEDSDYKTPAEMEEERKKVDGPRNFFKALADFPSKAVDWYHEKTGTDGFAKYLDPLFYVSRVQSTIANIPIDAADGLADRKMANKSGNALEKAWTKEREERDDALAPYLDSVKDEIINTMDNSQIKKTFLDNLKFGEDRGHIFSAYFDEDGNPKTTEGQNISIEDMVEYLAKKQVYGQMYDEQTAAMMLENWGQETIDKKQGFWRKTQLLGTDVAIGAITYIADQYNAARRTGLLAADEWDKMWGNEGRETYLDNNGNVIPKAKAIANSVTNENGQLVYTDPDTGESQIIHKEEMSRIALDDLGLNEDGEERDLLNNVKYINAMDMYKTANKELLNEYMKLGHSPNQVVWAPGDDTHIAYESLKMASFIMADWLLGATGEMVQGIGKGARALGTKTVGKAGNLATRSTRALEGAGMAVNPVVTAGRTIEGLGATMQYAGKALEKIHPITSGMGIGHAYGRGKQQELAMENLANLEDRVQQEAFNEVQRKIVEEAGYRDKLMQRTQEIYLELLNDYDNELIKNRDQQQKTPEEMQNDEALLMEQAKQLALNDAAVEEANIIKGGDAYGEALANAHQDASNAAIILAATVGAKYMGVNLWGWRKHLFKTQKQLAQAEARDATRRVMMEDTGRASMVSKFDTWTGRGKEFIKASKDAFIGGAWTNLTDELQSWGATQINRDSFSMYMNGMFDPQAEQQTMSVMDGIHSYFSGVGAGFGENHTYIAGLVGGLGAFLPSVPLGSSMVEASADTNKASWFEKNVFPWVTNSALSSYYAAKQGERAIQQKIALYNKLWDDNKDDLAAINDLLAIDIAKSAAMDQADQDAVDYLQGVSSVHAFNLYAQDPEMRALMEKNPVAANMFDVLEKLTNPESLTQAEAEDFISMWYRENPGIPRSEENNKEALEELSKKAQQLKGITEQYDNIVRKIAKYEADSGITLPNYLKNKLVYRLALQDHFFPEQIANMEEAITGNKEIASTSAPAEAFGNREHQQKFLNMVNPIVEEAKKEQEAAIKRADDVRERLSTYNDRELTDSEKKEKEDLEKELAGEEAASNYYYSVQLDMLDMVNSITDRLSSEGEEKVLTADEILRLEPIARAAMLNPQNARLYSAEQRAEIKKLVNKLLTTDPMLLSLIQSQARMVSHKKANDRSIEQIMTDPYYAAHHQETVGAAKATYFNEMQRMQVAQTHNDIIEQATQVWRETGAYDGDLFVSEDEFNNHIYDYLKTLTPKELEVFKELYEDDALPDTLASNIDLIDKAIEWKKFSANVVKAEQNNFDLATDEGILTDSAVEQVMTTVSTKEEAMAAFEDLINTRTVNRAVKENLRKVVDELNGIENQEATITPMSKKAAAEAKKAVRAMQREIRERAKKALEEAKKKADEETIIYSPEENTVNPIRVTKKTADLADRLNKQNEDLLQEYTQKANETTTDEELDGLEEELLNTLNLPAGITVDWGYDTSSKKFNLSIQPIKAVGDTTSLGYLNSLPTKFEVGDDVSFMHESSAYKGKVTKVDESGKIQEVRDNEDGRILVKDGKALSRSEISDQKKVEGKEDGVIVIPLNMELANDVLGKEDSKWEEYLQKVKYENGVSRKASAHIFEDVIQIAMEAGILSERYKSLFQKKKTIAVVTNEEIEVEEFHAPEAVLKKIVNTLKKLGIDSPAELLNFIENNVGKNINDILKEKESQLKEDNKGESDSLEDQSKEDPENVKLWPDGIPESKGTVVTVEGAGDHLLGNTLYGFNESFKETGKLEVRKPGSTNDLFDQWLDWLNKNNIKIYNIIDEELGDIAKSNPDVHIVHIKGDADTDKLMKSSLLAVEYTSEVAKYHNNDNGGVFKAQGKEYLLIGFLGYNGDTQKNIWSPINNQGNGGRDQYFRNNPSSTDKFFVLPGKTTKIRHIDIGHTVKQMPGDATPVSDKNPMPIMDIVNDPERNPKGYQPGELKWAIQRQMFGAITVNIAAGDKIHGVDRNDNKGSVYLLLRGANGEYGPAVVPHIEFGQINDGPLKDRVNAAIDKIASPDLATREQGLNEIKGLLWLAKERNDLATYMGITVGEEGDDKVRLWQNGVAVKQFNPKTSDIKEELRKAIQDMPYIININANVLRNPTLIKEYSDAGALSVDAANLNKRNANFTVYPIGADGRAAIPESPVNPSSPTSRPPSSVSTSVSTVTIGRIQYEKSSTGKWTDAKGKEVTAPDVIRQLENRRVIKENNLQPDQVTKGTSYYIVSRGESPVVIKVSGNNYQTMDTEAAKNKITEIDEKRAAKEREDNAATRLNRKIPSTIPKELADVYEQVKDIPEAVERLEKTEPEDIYEAASVVLASHKILWRGDKYSKGTKAETGYGDAERRKIFNMFRSKENGGKSIQELSEDAMQEVCAINGISDYDSGKARDALIELIRTATKPSDITNYILNNRREQALKIKEDYDSHLESLEEQYYYENYGMSKADYEEYQRNQSRKDYEEYKTPEEEASLQLAEKIQANEAGTRLTDDGKFYTDNEGNLKLRVTSGRDADPTMKPFEGEDYKVPSEAVGNSMDVFGRDAFEHNLGNRENLDERYYNADNESLNHLASQYDALEDKILGGVKVPITDDTGKTIGYRRVGGKTPFARNMTISGVLPVHDRTGKVVGEIDVAGTLDLVVVDKNGDYEIYDFKTFRAGSPWYKTQKPENIKWRPRQSKVDEYHWQLTAYKLVMQQQGEGVRVSKKAAVPVQAFYEHPNGMYDAANKDNPSNYTSEAVNGQNIILKENGNTVNVMPNMVDMIEFNKDYPIQIRFDKLTPAQQALVRPINPSTGTAETRRVSTPSENSSRLADVNEFERRSSSGTTSTGSLTIRNVLTHPERGLEVLRILQKKYKDFPSKASEIEAFLERNGVATTNIKSIDKFIDDLKEC